MTTFDDAWKTWIWTNVASGCSKDQIFKILYDHGFPYGAIASELGQVPSSPLHEIENPYPAAQGERVDEAADEAGSFAMAKLAPFLWGLTNVLSEEQCAVLIEAAKPRLAPSTVVVDPTAYGAQGSGQSEVRRGHSASIDPRDELGPELRAAVDHLTGLVAELTQLPVSHQEPIQILHYAQSDHFSLHHDSFAPGTEYFKWEGERGGQRLFTFMGFLNDVEEGGETEFPNLGVKIAPGRGKAGFWYDVLNGKLCNETHHLANPVIKGEKWALAIWVREAPYGRPTPEREAARQLEQARYVEWITTQSSLERPEWIAEQVREQQARTPFFGGGGTSCKGFEKRKLDPSVCAAILENYEALKRHMLPETDSAVGTFVGTVSGEFPPSLYCEDTAFNQKILDLLKATHEEWCGFELEPAACYGFRVYMPGAYLHNHVDRGTTHVVSSTICVASEIYAPWPLQVIDIDGRHREVNVEPGEHVIYESAKIEHGRSLPLHGRYYVGLFVHYRPACDWEGWIESPIDWWQREQARRGSPPRGDGVEY